MAWVVLFCCFMFDVLLIMGERRGVRVRGVGGPGGGGGASKSRDPETAQKRSLTRNGFEPQSFCVPTGRSA